MSRRVPRWTTALIAVLLGSSVIAVDLAVAAPDDEPEIVQEEVPATTQDASRQDDPQGGPNADNDVTDELAGTPQQPSVVVPPLKGGVTEKSLPSNLGTNRAYESVLLSIGITGGFTNDSGTWATTRSSTPARLLHVTADGQQVDKSATFNAGGAWAVAEVGNRVVVGANNPGGLHVFDSRNPQRATVIALHPDDTPMAIAEAGGNKVYVGAYNPQGARLYSVDLSTGSHTLIRSWSRELYVRSMVADGSTLFFTVGAPTRLYMLSNGVISELDRNAMAGASLGYSIAVSPEKLVVGTEPNGVVAVFDRTQKATPTLVRRVSIPGAQTVDSIAIDGSFAYFTTRSDGDFYSLDLTDPTSKPRHLGQPLLGEEYRSMSVREGELRAVGGSGSIATATVNDGGASGLEGTIFRDMRALSPVWGQETLSQGAAQFDGRFLTFGHWNMSVTDPVSGDFYNTRVPGEVKASATVNGQLFLGIYPSARIYRLKPGTTKPEHFASIPGEQMRPRAIESSSGGKRLIVSTRPAYGRFGGNLTVVDAATGEITRQLSRPFGNDTATALVATRDALYVGTENYGEAVALPAAQAGKAQVLKMGPDASSGRSWATIPVPGASHVTSLVLTEKGKSQWLIGTTNNGYVFVVDPANGQVKHRQKVGSHADQLSVVNGRIMLRIDSRLHEGDIGLSDVFLFKISDAPVRWLSRNPDSETGIATVELGSDRAHELHAYDLRTSAQARRIGGRDRFDVAINASYTGFGKSDHVILVNYLAYADQVAAMPLSKVRNAPILLTQAQRLDKRSLAEIKRLGARAVTIVGGPPSVSDGIAAELRANGLQVSRMNGRDRFAVAVSVAHEIERIQGRPPSNIYVATGLIYSDGVIAAPAAAHHNGVVVFTANDRMMSSTRDYLRSRSAVRKTSVGAWADTALKREGIAVRTLSGKNRFEVAAQVARADFPTTRAAFMANGLAYADAVIASSLASVNSVPVLLDRASPIDKATHRYLMESKRREIVVTMVGGPPSLSLSNQLAIRMMIN